MTLVDRITAVVQAIAADIKNCVINGGQNGAVTIGTNDNYALTLKASGAARYSVASGKANIISGPAGGVDSNSSYAASIQNNAAGSWLEILNNGGAGKGCFFGMSGNNFELWNYQFGGTAFYLRDNGSPGYFYMLYLNTNGTISLGRDNKVTLDFSNVSATRTQKFPDRNCTLGDVSSTGQAGALTIGSTDSNAVTLQTNLVTRIHIPASGKVGVGNFTSPQAQLHVHETSVFSSSAAKFTRGSQTGVSDGAEFGQDSSNNAYLKSFAGNLFGIRGSDFGSIPALAFCIQRSTYTLTSSTSLQKIFNTTTNGALTVVSGTTYFFECSLNLSAMSATSGNFGFSLLGAGTATLTSAAWHSIGLDSTVQTTVAANGGIFSAADGYEGNIITPQNGTSASVRITGTFTVNAGGTIIPSLQLTTAAAAVVGVNSWFRCTPACASGTSYIGNWS